MSLPTGTDEIVLIHNPRCSKSRAAKELLEEAGVDFTLRLYLEAPLSRDELEDLAGRLGSAPGAWVRRGEAAYEAAGLAEGASEQEIFDAMAAHPILVERPIAVRGARAVVGRPPERVLDLAKGG